MTDIMTKEGFSIKKMQHFPSIEYGENGGTACDLLLNGKKIASFFDAGDGGEAQVTWLDPSKQKEYEDLATTASARLEPEEVKKYGMDIIKACAISSLVSFLDDSQKNLKLVLKWKVKGYPFTAFANLQHGFRVATMGCLSKDGEKDASFCKKTLAEFLKVKEDDEELTFHIYNEASFSNL